MLNMDMFTSKFVDPIIQDFPIEIAGLKKNFADGLVSLNSNVCCVLCEFVQ